MLRIVAEAVGESFRTQFREVAGALLHRRHGGECGYTLIVAETFVVAEEEDLVLADRPANGGAELVLPQWQGLRLKIVTRVDSVIAQEVPQRAMELVRARARDDVGRRAQGVGRTRRLHCA